MGDGFSCTSADPGRGSGTFRTGVRDSAWWQWNRKYWRWIGRQYLHAASFRPDWVIATHPFALAAWGGVRFRRFQLLGVVTDLSAHCFWWEPEADAYAVWLPETLPDLLRCGADAGTIWQTGIPIGREFASVRADREGPLVVMAGGLGLGPVGPVVDELVRLGRPIHVVCGRNLRLRSTLSQRHWPKTQVYGYVDNLAALLNGAAVLVSKPGGLTAAESAAARVPLVVPYCLPGQEQVNAERLVAAGLAVHERSVTGGVVKCLAPATWNGIRDRQRLLGRCRASEDLARTLVGDGLSKRVSAPQKFLD